MADNKVLFPWASRRRVCPCDLDGVCPYDAETGSNCDYWCPCDDTPAGEEEIGLDP